MDKTAIIERINNLLIQMYLLTIDNYDGCYEKCIERVRGEIEEAERELAKICTGPYTPDIVLNASYDEMLTWGWNWENQCVYDGRGNAYIYLMVEL